MTTAPGHRHVVRRGAAARAECLPNRKQFALPIAGLAVTITGLVLLSRNVLGAVAAGGSPRAGELVLYALAGVFLLAVAIVGVWHAARLAERIAGPECRLIESLRRMRNGDLSFRVTLRKGDPMTGIADECNRLLEWLNQNPPQGACTGNDVFEVEQMEADVVEVES